MTNPNPDTEPPAWYNAIETLLDSSRRRDPAEGGTAAPAWLPQAVHVLGGWMQTILASQVQEATTNLQTQLDQARRDSTVGAGQLRKLRDEIRLYLAELSASGDNLDRDDANEALRGWSIDPLPRPLHRHPQRHHRHHRDRGRHRRRRHPSAAHPRRAHQ